MIESKYPKINSPKGEPSKKWLDRAFTPLRKYLEQHHSGDARKIEGFLMFMGNENEKFYYKNSITRSYIVFDQRGELESLSEDALEHEFEWLKLPERKSPAIAMEDIHPSVNQWIEENLDRKTAIKYGRELRLFLQELWAPFCNFDFSDLKVGFPLGRVRTPYCLYISPTLFAKQITFHFPGDEIVERSCGMQHYRDYWMRDQEVRLYGWQSVAYWREHLEVDLTYLRQELQQCIDLAEPRSL